MTAEQQLIYRVFVIVWLLFGQRERHNGRKKQPAKSQDLFRFPYTREKWTQNTNALHLTFHICNLSFSLSFSSFFIFIFSLSLPNPSVDSVDYKSAQKIYEITSARSTADTAWELENGCTVDKNNKWHRTSVVKFLAHYLNFELQQ